MRGKADENNQEDKMELGFLGKWEEIMNWLNKKVGWGWLDVLLDFRVCLQYFVTEPPNFLLNIGEIIYSCGFKEHTRPWKFN